MRASGRAARWFFDSWIFHVIRLVFMMTPLIQRNNETVSKNHMVAAEKYFVQHQEKRNAVSRSEIRRELFTRAGFINPTVAVENGQVENG